MKCYILSVRDVDNLFWSESGGVYSQYFYSLPVKNRFYFEIFGEANNKNEPLVSRHHKRITWAWQRWWRVSLEFATQAQVSHFMATR